MSVRLHNHGFNGVTTVNDRHTHNYAGLTNQAPDIPGHTHTMMGEVSFADGHIHRYSFNTSAPIEVDGGHTHFYMAETSFNSGHTHGMDGYTTVS